MIAGILLAAGGARRFRSQKLVALLEDVPVVRLAAGVLATGVDEITIVVGSEAPRVTAAVAGLGAQVIENAEWEKGLAGSLRRGLAALPNGAEAAVVTLGDQPRVDPMVIRAVIDRWRESGMPIVSASYRGARAHPVLFAREVFDELLALEGDAGARLLIERRPERVAYVEIDDSMPRDVDTPDDLDALQRERAHDRPVERDQ